MSEHEWVGFSIVAAGIVGLAAYLFSYPIYLLREQRKRGEK